MIEFREAFKRQVALKTARQYQVHGSVQDEGIDDAAMKAGAALSVRCGRTLLSGAFGRFGGHLSGTLVMLRAGFRFARGMTGSSISHAGAEEKQEK